MDYILSQKLVTSLPHNHVILTSLFISSYRGYCYQICAVKTTPCSSLGVVMSLPFHHMTLINLYTSSYREATGYDHTRERLSCHGLLVSKILR